MIRRLVSRRGLFRQGFAGVAAIASARAGAQAPGGDDRGIGGTGAAPTGSAGEDRGIGGTGVIGTIRGFGSIVVNGLHISYPDRVDVTIDGEAATASSLRLGQVVEVLAAERAGRYATRRIAVVHEVVGPVQALDRTRLRVMGQEVALAEGIEAGHWREGDVVAVSGLRRFDDTIVASLVERPSTSTLRVTGRIERGRDGLRLGGLDLSGVDEGAVGSRLVLEGRLLDERFEVRSVATPAETLLAQRPARLSLEAYVVRQGRGLHVSGMVDVSGVAPVRGPAPDRPVRAILAAHIDAAGAFHVDSVRAAGHPKGSEPGGAQPGHGTGSEGPSGRPGAGPSRGGDADGGPAGRGGPGQGGPGRGAGGRR